MNCLTFKELVDKNGLKDEATINIKIQQIVNTNRRFAPARCELRLPTKVYMRYDNFTTTAGIVNLHPTERTHWVVFINE